MFLRDWREPLKDKESLVSILDEVSDDLKRVASELGKEDRSLLEEHLTLVRELERDLQRIDEESDQQHPEPELTHPGYWPAYPPRALPIGLIVLRKSEAEVALSRRDKSHLDTSRSTNSSAGWRGCT